MCSNPRHSFAGIKMMWTVLLRRMGSRKSCTAWSSLLMQMLVLPSQSTARLRRSLLVAWPCKSWSCGLLEGYRTSQVRSLANIFPFLPVKQCCCRWWKVDSLSVLYTLIALNIAFTSFPHKANFLSCSHIGLSFGCGETILCATKERNSQLCAFSHSKMIYKITEANTLLSKYDLFFQITPLNGFLCSLEWEHLGHQRGVQLDMYMWVCEELRPIQSPIWE